MEELNAKQESLYYGGKEHRPPQISYLRAGPLHCQYEAGYLRYLKVGGKELLRMIYPAVRDHNWETVPPQVINETLNIAEDHFEIRYECLYREGEIHFLATYLIQGDAEGNISFILDGEAISSFRKNRIGFNVLHPAEASGAKYETLHSDGSSEEGRFPEVISPHQPLMDIKTLRWEVQGLWAEVDFEGDVFEMEDQRNWTDASFKTYSTPLALPFPVTIEKGSKIQQQVSLCLKNQPDEDVGPEVKAEIRFGKQVYDLPAIGVAQSSEEAILSEQDIAWLRMLPFTHYRVDIWLGDREVKQKWQRATKESRALEIPLELALYFAEENDIINLKELLEGIRPAVRQVLVFSQHHKSTPDNLLSRLLPELRALFPFVPIGAGTDCFFAELNRQRVKHQGLDFLTYSINPQVHQFDNQSLIETLQAQAYTLEGARDFADDKEVFISPITLKMRFNPNATGSEPVPNDKLPPQVDTRQMSLFGAGWTLGSVKYLTEKKLSSVTYFETVGRRGILPGSSAVSFPQQEKPFYPLYWVFYHLLRHKDIQIIKSECGDPLQFSCLAWTKGQYLYLMIANLKPMEKEVLINTANFHWEQISLNGESFMAYPEMPDKWKDEWVQAAPLLKMEPYSLYLLRSLFSPFTSGAFSI